MRERSRAYPGESLSKAIEFLRVIRSGLGTTWFARSDAARALKVAEGTVVRIVAALSQYGLLEKRSGGEYRVSPLGSGIIEPISDSEMLKLRREAALKPTLFQDVFEVSSEDGQLPTQLRSILIRNHGIAAKAADSAAETLKDTFEFAQLFCRPNYTSAVPIESEDLRQHGNDESSTSVLPARKEGLQDLNAIPQETQWTTRPVPSRDAGRENTNSGDQVFVVALSSGRKARIELPSVVTERDLKILRRQLDVIELQISDE